jgi:hypothetical protein
VCAPQRPLHLLLLDEPLADDLIDRGFHKRCTDGFALTIAFLEVGDELDVVSDVSFELTDALAKLVSCVRERSK